MYVYVCICMYMYVYVRICTYICTYMYVYMYVCICIYMYVYMYVCICTYMYVYVCICTYVYVRICMYMYVCMCKRVVSIILVPLINCDPLQFESKPLAKWIEIYPDQIRFGSILLLCGCNRSGLILIRSGSGVQCRHGSK